MAKSIEFTGYVKNVTELKGEKDGKAWVKHSVVVEEIADKFPAGFVIEAFNKADEVAKCAIGALVKVFVNHSVNEYNGKFYNKIDLWKAELIEAAPATDDLPY